MQELPALYYTRDDGDAAGNEATRLRMPYNQAPFERLRHAIGRCFPGASLVLIFLFGGLDFVLRGLEFPVAAALLIGLLYFVTPRRTDYRLWGFYLAGFALFEGLTTLADSTGIAVTFTLPASLEQIVFGTSLSAWLQGHFYRPGRIGALDLYCSALYASFFLHYVAGFILWRVRQPKFQLYVTAMLATVFLGLIGYFLFPEAPPWLANQRGVISGVVRITTNVSDRLWPGIEMRASGAAGVNLVAAMPSLHVAVATIVWLALHDVHRFARALGMLYAVSMWFAVVYLGEHYMIDVVLGILLATIVYRSMEWWTRSEVERPAPREPMPSDLRHYGNT